MGIRNSLLFENYKTLFSFGKLIFLDKHKKVFVRKYKKCFLRACKIGFLGQHKKFFFLLKIGSFKRTQKGWCFWKSTKIFFFRLKKFFGCGFVWLSGPSRSSLGDSKEHLFNRCGEVCFCLFCMLFLFPPGCKRPF